MVMVDDAVVPRRARSVVVAVYAFHIGVACEPVGVVVFAAHSVFGCSYWLAAGDDAFSAGPFGQLVCACGNIYEQPVVEIDAGKIGGNEASLLVNVFSGRGHIWIVANKGKRLGAFWRVRPADGGAKVVADSEGTVFARFSESETGGNWTLVRPGIDGDGEWVLHSG